MSEPRNNTHHIIPRCRWKGRRGKTVSLDKCFHESWHRLFYVATPVEAMKAVAKVCGKGPHDGRRTIEDVAHIAVSCVGRTERRIKRLGGQEVYTTDTFDWRPVASVPVRIDWMDGDLFIHWRRLFGELPTVGLICRFIQRIMQPDRKWKWHSIVELRRELLAEVTAEAA